MASSPTHPIEFPVHDDRKFALVTFPLPDTNASVVLFPDELETGGAKCVKNPAIVFDYISFLVMIVVSVILLWESDEAGGGM